MSALRYHPVHRDRRPQYPTKLAALADPSLLRRHVPAPWLSRPEIAGTLSLVLAGSAAGCRPEVRGSPRPEAAQVAPVFVHGKGIAESLTPSAGVAGMLGCIAVAAPTYLPEDEALAIIADELRSAGLTPSAQNVPMKSVIVRGRVLRSGLEWVSDHTGSAFEPAIGPLVADLADAQQHVYVEYVTPEDFYLLGGDDTRSYSANLKEGAALAGRAVAGQAHGVWFGAFYDPVEYYGFGEGDRSEDAEVATPPPGETKEQREQRELEALLSWFKRGEAKGQERAKAHLRAQAQDFVNWLKAQGAI